MEWESALKTADVVDYKFSMGTYEYPESYAVLPSEATFELNGNYDNYIYTTFTNTTPDILYDLYLTSALFDAEGNLIFVDGNSSSSVGVHPQNTVTLKTYIDGDILKYYQAHGITAERPLYGQAIYLRADTRPQVERTS